MNQSANGFSEYSNLEVDRLLAGFERGELTAAEVDQLNLLILHNVAARRRFIRGLALIASLEWGGDRNSATEPATEPQRPRHFVLPSRSRRLISGMAISGALGLAVCAFVMVMTYQPAKMTAPIRQSAAQPVAAAYVARIVKASSDCRWGELTSPVEFLVRVRAGDHLHIAAGLVELEFYSGARIILHGPAVFKPTGVASGHLESGRLTGEVADGNFRLITPAAEVIDLGTSFGVAADAAVGTDVVVFDGRVQVVSRAEGGRAGETLDMTEGMAARFRVDGSTEYGLRADAAEFKRVVSPNNRPTTGDEICLIDLIAGGDGLGARLAGAIDPLTGRKDYGERRRQPTGSARRFREIPWHSMIDGVFIPSQEGRPSQLDSQGHQANLPVTINRSWGPIWARSREGVSEKVSDLNDDFWGDKTLTGIVERLQQTRKGLVGMHANVGIAFDLRAIQLVHRRLPSEFRGTVANLENSHEFPPEQNANRQLTASVYIYVDGNLRYERTEFSRNDGEPQFTVPLAPEDRFLTIVSTDDGDITFDHVVLVDPVIALEKIP